ncbi:MAG TPA: histidine phosphatase family protein [Tissierellia bacterium]|nr:histidine phosphatase family protein [Tissierellia bacterium]
MQLLFVRHGQTDNNAKRLIQGKNDVALNANGLAQAEAIAEVLSKESFSVIISSPLKRAYQTAMIIARRVGRPIEVDERLVERDFGLLQDQSYDKLRIHPASGRPDFFCDAYQEYRVEPICGMIARVSDFLDDLSHRDEPSVLIVAHGGIGYLFDQILAGVKTPIVSNNGQVRYYRLARKKD